MQKNLRFEDFLSMVGKTYKAIDLRIAAAKTNDKWMNALLVIRVSPDDIIAVKSKQEELKEKWSKFLETDRLRFVLDSLPFNEFEALCGHLKQGKYKTLQGDIIELSQSVDLLSLQCDFPTYGWAKEARNWPYFIRTGGEHLRLLYQSEDITQGVQLLGLVTGNREEPYILIRELLEVHDYRSGTSFDILAVAPFLAQVEQDIVFDGQ